MLPKPPSFLQKLAWSLTHPVTAGLFQFCKLYNTLVDRRAAPVQSESDDPPDLAEIKARARKRSDISDHLVTIFTKSLAVEPKLIVELGVRDGESTFVLERAARRSGAVWVGVDLEDCAKASSREKWFFVQDDDVTFAGAFGEWCRGKGIEPVVDVLMIDTDHTFDHTRAEIAAWFPFLADAATVFLHDTNLRRVYFRQDGSMGIGWRNERGVIRALEDYLGCSFRERRDFATQAGGWAIEHHAGCCGLTVLTRGGPK